MRQKRDLFRLFSLLIFLAWVIFCIVILSNDAKAKPEDDRLPGDNIPATERCCMTDAEIREDYENFYIEQALLTNAHKIEDVTVTYYCICEKCCGKSPDDPGYGITASGLKAAPGVSVGVDTSVIPLGSDVLLDYGDGEIRYMRADDTGCGIAGNHIDVCVGSHEEALLAGVKTATVYWVAA